MIEVITSGKDKTFFVRCSMCGSDLHYQYEDVWREKSNLPYCPDTLYITCPVCGEKVFAQLLTEEETKTQFFNPILPISYGGVNNA